MGHLKADMRSSPVRTLVVMGESNAFGMIAADPQNEWPQVLASLIRRHQDGFLRAINASIPSNVISPSSPGYAPFTGEHGVAPSALERYVHDAVRYGPDLCIYAYGLNDSRCGHPPESFLTAYETIVEGTRRRLPEALVVLVGPYWNVQYDEDLWSEGRYNWHRTWFGEFNRSGDDLVEAYNAGIADLAARHGCLFVDLYSLLKGALWLLHDDACHFTDIGHTVIGLEIFSALATNSSFLAKKSEAAARDGRFTVRNTGGTNGLPDAIKQWRDLADHGEAWMGPWADSRPDERDR